MLKNIKFTKKEQIQIIDNYIEFINKNVDNKVSLIEKFVLPQFFMVLGVFVSLIISFKFITGSISSILVSVFFVLILIWGYNRLSKKVDFLHKNIDNLNETRMEIYYLKHRILTSNIDENKFKHLTKEIDQVFNRLSTKKE